LLELILGNVSWYNKAPQKSQTEDAEIGLREKLLADPLKDIRQYLQSDGVKKVTESIDFRHQSSSSSKEKDYTEKRKKKMKKKIKKLARKLKKKKEEKRKKKRKRVKSSSSASEEDKEAEEKKERELERLRTERLQREQVGAYRELRNKIMFPPALARIFEFDVKCYYVYLRNDNNHKIPTQNYPNKNIPIYPFNGHGI